MLKTAGVWLDKEWPWDKRLLPKPNSVQRINFCLVYNVNTSYANQLWETCEHCVYLSYYFTREKKAIENKKKMAEDVLTGNV